MKQPSKAAQQELLSMDQNLPTKVSIPRSKATYNITWMKPYTSSKISQIILENEIPEDMDSKELIKFMAKKIKVIAKGASYVILNNFWTIKFFHAIHWRWLFYIKQYDFEQLQPIVLEGKKKMAEMGFYSSMMLLVMTMDTIKTMTKMEVERYLQGRLSE